MAINVSLRGIVHDDFHYTFNLSQASANEAVAADAGRLAVMVDPAAANQVKLVGDGDQILGRLEIFEDRTKTENKVVGTVALKGGMRFLVNPDAATSPDERPAVGDFLVGDARTAGKRGYVRKATTAELAEGKRQWQVVEAAADHLSVIAIRV